MEETNIQWGYLIILEPILASPQSLSTRGNHAQTKLLAKRGDSSLHYYDLWETLQFVCNKNRFVFIFLQIKQDKNAKKTLRRVITMKLQKGGENENQLKTKIDEGILLLFCWYYYFIIIFINHYSMNMGHEMVLEKFKVLILLQAKFENQDFNPDQLLGILHSSTLFK